MFLLDKYFFITFISIDLVFSIALSMHILLKEDMIVNFIIELYNNGYVNESIIYATLYDSNNNLKHIKTSSNLLSLDYNKLSLSFDLNDIKDLIENNDLLKIIIADKLTLKPIGVSETFIINI